VRILITGGAGFVGASLAKHFQRYYEGCEVTAFDSLKRRGSELNIPDFKTMGIRFVHGDIRTAPDFLELRGDFDLIVDASAEPSVHAGTVDAPDHVVHTNFTGTFNCLNFARHRARAFVFLSTSRVYSITPLREIGIEETATRFEITAPQQQPGVTPEGISEDFPTHSARSLYGATKLASEMLLQEFVAAYGMNGVIYRCGVIAGPGQFGKADQGVFTLWLVNHYFQKPLGYTGFGGSGKQVRDLIHPLDLADLICCHLPTMSGHRGQVFNVGGGRSVSVSLAELTEICRDLTGNVFPIASRPETAQVDIPIFITDSRRICEAVGWKPSRDVDTIFKDTLSWIQANESPLRLLFC
jgi:CDP-paratose 2-epimerase